MKKIFIPVILAGFLSLISMSSVPAASVWDVATPYPEQNFHTQNILMFAKEIEQATGGLITVKVHSNASLLKMPDIKPGVQIGQAALWEILLSAYGNEDPFFQLDGIPFVSTGYDTAKSVWEKTKPFIERALRGEQGGPRTAHPRAGPRVGEHQIRVNCVAPGSVPTDINREVLAVPENRQRNINKTALKRLGTPHDIAAMVAFLASDLAGYITGQTIYTDGGWTLS